MKITVFGVDIDLKETEYKNVGDIIDTIESQGAIVVEVIADEEDITNFSAAELEAIMPIKDLKIIAKSKKDLIIDSLEEVENYIPRLIEGIDNIVKLFTQGNEPEGYQLLMQLFEGIEWLNMLLGHMEKDMQINEMMFNIINKAEFVDQWQNSIEELLSAMENQDTIFLSDILEYEVTPVLKDYFNLAKDLNIKLS
ncbi:hypothetical protein U472_03530 [Orenia metallireducens]|uniref:DUF8042 domain-containing protein n=1 Tax=Orenia metallireducens TaxID=1413210 RepID=A0A1C0AB80_9FIRM|nr:hypothetical protein [Orenia metallireducens]OCL27633.1 hypothetical protein U472_03530 [Orenia metallireducens]